MSPPRTEQEWAERIREDVAAHPVLVYAKGEKNAAVCGFSHRVMELFNRLGVDYEVRDVFADPLIRPALATVTESTTTPQVFIGGRFVGGCDVVAAMAETGELQQLLERALPASARNRTARG